MKAPGPWARRLDAFGECVFRGRFLQQFAALFYKNGERWSDWRGVQRSIRGRRRGGSSGEWSADGAHVCARAAAASSTAQRGAKSKSQRFRWRQPPPALPRDTHKVDRSMVSRSPPPLATR